MLSHAALSPSTGYARNLSVLGAVARAALQPALALPTPSGRCASLPAYTAERSCLLHAKVNVT